MLKLNLLICLLLLSPEVFSTIILYENRFTGSSTTSYAPSEFWPESCYVGDNWNTACASDLRSYSGWTSTDATLVFNDLLITICGSNKYFGGSSKFGGINTVTRTYTALPDHSKFRLKLDLIRIDAWEGTDKLEIFIDGSATAAYTVPAGTDGSAMCGVAGENDKEISIDLNPAHSSPGLIIAFKTNLDQTNALESWGIRNYKLYLETNCLASCLTCNALTPTSCISCPNIAEKSGTACTCLSHFFMKTDDNTHCEECNYECLTCDGIANNQCKTCYSDHTLTSGSCVKVAHIYKFPVEFNGGFSDSDVSTTWTVTGHSGGLTCPDSECGKYKMVGGYKSFGVSAKMTKTFTSLLPHYKAGYHLDFYKIDSWDNEHLYIKVDTVIKTDKTYSPDKDNQFVRNIIGMNYNDYIDDIFLIFDHSINTLAIEISTNLDSAATDESWGIANFQLFIYLCYPTCLTCSSELQTSCVTCYPNANKDASNKCVCNDHYYMKTYATPCTVYPCSVCEACDLSCLTCTGTLPTQCLTCSTDRYFESNECKPCSTYKCTACTSPTFCTACITGYVLNGNVCQIGCPSNTFPDSVTSTCTSCHSSCKTCTGSTSNNCQTCNANQYLSAANACINCDSPCATCSNSPTSCTSCITGNILSGTSCLSGGCPTHKWNRVSDNSCQPCDSTCKECTTGSPTACSSCYSGTYEYSGRCLPCDTCKTCTENANKCIDCNTGRFLQGSACLLECLAGFYGKTATLTCESCNSNCYKCNGPNINSCTACTSPKILISGECKSCVNCKTCETTQTKCLSCDTPMVLSRINPNTCVINCETNEYKRISDNSCQPCDSTCLTCDGGGTNKYCTSCVAKKYLDNNRCYDCDATCTTCETASANCLTCTVPLYFYQNKCETGCLSTHFANDLTAKCELCDSNCVTCETTATNCLTCVLTSYLTALKVCSPCTLPCKTCVTSSTNCLTCDPPYYFYLNTCISPCNNGFYGQDSDRTCQPCNSACLTCSGSTAQNCKTCVGGKTLNLNTECVDCDSTCVLCLGLGNKNCETCKPNLYYSEASCISQCLNGYYSVETPIKKCMLCDSSCLTCKGAGPEKCLVCISLYYFKLIDKIENTGSCYSSCPKPLYSNSGTGLCSEYCLQGQYLELGTLICKQCFQSCLTCRGPWADNCLSCYKNDFLLESKCVKSCYDGFFPDKEKNICVKCSTNCTLCSNLTICEKCNDKSFLDKSLGICSQCIERGKFPNKIEKTCNLCQTFCQNCTNYEKCLECDTNFSFLKNDKCNPIVYLKPELIAIKNNPNLFVIRFNGTFPDFFNNITNNISYHLNVNITNIEDKSLYKYKVKKSFKNENSFEIGIEFFIPVKNTYVVNVFLSPGEEDFIKLTEKILSINLTSIWITCLQNEIQIFNYTTQNCENLNIVVPKIKRTTNPLILLLEFSEDFFDFFDIMMNITKIEIMNAKNYNFTMRKTEKILIYEINLNYSENSLGKRILKLNFLLPLSLQYHEEKRLIPNNLSIELFDYYGEEYSEIKFLEGYQNIAEYLLYSLSSINAIFLHSSLSYNGIIAVNLIKYLRYIDVSYPPNAMAAFTFEMGKYSLFPEFYFDNNNNQNSSKPNRKFEFYNIDAFVLKNSGSKIMEGISFLSLGLIVQFGFKYFVIRMKRKGLNIDELNSKIKKIYINMFYYTIFLIFYEYNFMDVTFYCLLNLMWFDLNSDDGILNFSFTLTVLISLLAFLILLFLLLFKLNLIFKDIRYHIKNNTPFINANTTMNNNSNNSNGKDPTGFNLIDSPQGLDKSKDQDILLNDDVHLPSSIQIEKLKRKTWWNPINSTKNVNNNEDDEIKEEKNGSKNEIKDLQTQSAKKNSLKRKSSGNSQNSEDFDWRKKYWPYFAYIIFFKDYRKRKTIQILYVWINMHRCLLIVTSVVLFNFSYYNLSILYFSFNVTFISYLIFFQPFKRFKMFFSHIFIEICVFFASGAAFLIAKNDENFMFEIGDRMYKGWVIYYSNLVLIVFLIIFNSLLIVINIFWQILIYIDKWKKNSVHPI